MAMRANQQQEALPRFLTRPLEDPVEIMVARAAGAVLLAFGLLLVLSVLLVVGVGGATLSPASAAKMERSVSLMYFLVLMPIGAFCCLVGVRLALQLRNKYGSLLSPASWTTVGIVFSVAGLWIGAHIVARGEYLELRHALALALFGVGSFGLATYLHGRAKLHDGVRSKRPSR